MYCKQCRNKISDDSTVCPFCKAPVEKKQIDGNKKANVVISIVFPIYAIINCFNKKREASNKKKCIIAALISCIASTIVSAIPVIGADNLYVMMYEIAERFAESVIFPLGVLISTISELIVH